MISIRETFFERIYAKSIGNELLEDLAKINEAMFMAAFISSKFHEEGDNESVTERRDNAILNELKNALTLIRGFNVKLDNNRNFLANTTTQDFVNEFEKCLKNVLVD